MIHDINDDHDMHVATQAKRAYVDDDLMMGAIPAKPAASQPRALYFIAGEIKRDWKKVYFGAVPYLAAMSTLNSIRDPYGADSGESIVRYFLGNAKTWKGEVAKRVKAELNAMLKARG